MGIVEQYLLQLKIEKRRLRRAAAILTVLSLLVATGVSWNLRMTGITIANNACCGMEEHLHTEDCPTERVLICGYSDTESEEHAEDPTQPPEQLPAEAPTEEATEPPTEAATEAPTEETEAPPEETSSPEVPPEETTSPTEETYLDLEEPSVPEERSPSPHVHTESCYQVNYLCGYEEHIHEITCYADETADIEWAVIWESTLPKQLGGLWAEDIVRVAQSQLGCGESERNFVLAEDGITKNGITRYGQWYGNPHGDWSGMFALFCLEYSQIPREVIPWSPGVYNMMRLAEAEGILLPPDGNMDTPGSLLFLDTDENGKADKIAIVTGTSNGELLAIGGDLDDTVKEIRLSGSDSRILGYINIREAQITYELEHTEGAPEETTVPTEEATSPTEETANPTEETTAPEEEIPEQSDEPVIELDVEFNEEDGTFCLVAQLTNINEFLFGWQWQYSEDGKDPWYDIEGATELTLVLEDTDENFQRYYRIQGQKVASTFAFRAAPASAGNEGIMLTSDAITPKGISKTGNTYTIHVYAIPVDGNGDRIAELPLTELQSQSINSTSKKTVSNWFDTSLGTYKSAYFGTQTTVSVDNINTVWRYRSGTTYYLAYALTNGTQNQRYLDKANTNISLFLRYSPQFTVTFQSEFHQTVTESGIEYREYPTLTAPGNWTREGYKLLGWTVDDNTQNIYTYDEIMNRPVTANVTYTAQWADFVEISFDLGDYVQSVYPIEKMTVSYGESLSPLPTPAWRNNEVSMAFDGWYLNPERTIPVTSDYCFVQDTILYAKWNPREDGYFVHFMDFNRENQDPLVLMTYSVTEGKTASPYTPGNAPAGTQWDGTWYLDEGCTTPYYFSTPVSSMTDYLTGAGNRDLYLYPGTEAVCRAIFVTYGTKIDPVTVPLGQTINLNDYTPQRDGYIFAGWTLKDGTPVSGIQTLDETTTYYATWDSGYVPFQAILRTENANDTDMTQADFLGTWYALSGSQIRVKSTYTGTGNNRSGSHQVVCVLNGTEYPVYTNAALTQQATLSDVYGTYFIYNNTGTGWTDEVNWEDVYTGGQLPYSTRPISSTGDTVIHFDYMRVRNDIVFTIPNSNTGAYIDIFKLKNEGLITGSVTYTGSTPTTTGKNVSATGVSGTNVRWTYTAATNSSGNNLYTLHDMKYGQRIYEVYPVGGSWLTVQSADFHWYKSGSNELFSSRRQDLSSDFFSGSGRKLTPYSLTAVFQNQNHVALMYAMECLEGETPDFTINNIGYKVQTQLCEVVNHTGNFSIKELTGCEDGINPLANQNTNYYSNLASTNATVGQTSVKTLFGTTYWDYYKTYVDRVNDIDRAYIFYYNRIDTTIQFNFAYDSDEDGIDEVVPYSGINYGENISQYQFGVANLQKHPLLHREGYEFAGWLDANGNVLDADDWAEMKAIGGGDGNVMIFIARWEKISNNIVEYYEDVSADTPFETHYFEDGSMMEFPTMAVYPEGWVWQEKGEGLYQRFDWDVPIYGEDGIQEIRIINGEEVPVNVIRIYGTWDESHTQVVYDPNPAQGGVPGSAPTDTKEYTIWQSEVSVKIQGTTQNADPDMLFVGWKLDRDGIVYQPGNHVPVRWPRTMIFTAQWAKPEEVVSLRYDPNGGIPASVYPNDSGFSYRKNSSAAVWENTKADGNAYFLRPGYTFTGWNTAADGSGTAYAPNDTIILTEPVTILYAQWETQIHTLSLHKIDSESKVPLYGAKFSLYWDQGGTFFPVQSQETGVDGQIIFPNLQTDVLYKLVEERPPDGYAIIAREIRFRLKPGDSSVSLVFYDDSGNEISSPNGATGEYVSGTKFLTLTVENLRGYALPATGGMGMYTYYLCGLMLALAPLVYGLSLRRKNERRLQK